MPKTAKNLYLDSEVLERAEEYGRRHGINLSQLVNQFLAALPLRRAASSHGPAVSRLIGAGLPRARRPKVAENEPGVDAYKRHLMKKYGRRSKARE